MDFRPRSWVVVASLGLVGAICAFAFAGIVALLFSEVATGENATAFGIVQLLVAGAGLVLAVVAVLGSARDRGSPWRWLVAAALVYGVWAVLLLIAVS